MNREYYDKRHKELLEMQKLPLDEKIAISKIRIAEFYDHYDGKVAISFSGGKDSTVLLHLVRSIYPEIKAVFVHTGLEYPEVVQHVRTFENVDIIRPEMPFHKVIKEYGWCYPSKEVAKKIYYARKGSDWAIKCMSGLNRDGSESEYRQRYKKWEHLIDSPIKIGDQCCNIMKKKPFKKYVKEHDVALFIGTMAEESQLRKQSWIAVGCNAFEHNKSQPMSFWTEQDVLSYIKRFDLKIPTVYGEIIENNGKLKCSELNRTGCMFCPIAVQREREPNRFQRMQLTHPKLHDYCINRLGLKELLDSVGVPYTMEDKNG